MVQALAGILFLTNLNGGVSKTIRDYEFLCYEFFKILQRELAGESHIQRYAGFAFVDVINYHVLSWEVRKVKNCDQGLENATRGHSFLLYGPTLS